jgi:hypothetical protein
MPSLSTAATRRWLTLAVFSVALVSRVAFWQATPDRDWPHSALYKGDALVWTAYAAALGRGQAFELGLPLRPPGNGYLLSWLGVTGPGDAGGAKLVWCLLGALAVALFFRAAWAAFDLPTAFGVALWCSFSTALMILSTSLNNETPYLVLVGILLLLSPRIAAERSSGPLLLWGAVNGLACLVRVEHALLFALGLAWLALCRRPAMASGRKRWRTLAVPLGLPIVAWGAVLAPWHLASWTSIHAFNTEERSQGQATEAAQAGIERALAGLAWTPAAMAEREQLPAFARRSASNFVAATVAWRGGREVDGDDFVILDQAFGMRPRPLQGHPLVALYGPLNFYLAQRPAAPVGFDPGGLDRPPPLVGGGARYPAPLIAGLPPRELNFQYPPHLELITDGYRLGAGAIAGNPTRFLRRSLARLEVLWQGASLGWTGYDLPWGLAGVRRAVDLAVPTGRSFAAWRLALFALCAGGLWLARREWVVWLWFLFALHKMVATVLFFGYARHGATLVPVVALLTTIALVRTLGRQRPLARRMPIVLLVMAALGLGLEARRWLAPPTLALDDRPVVARDPFPADDHLEHRLSVRVRR